MNNLASGHSLNNKALAAYVQGRTNGTIDDNCYQVIETILNQEVVSYCSKHATYTFDYNDLIEA